MEQSTRPLTQPMLDLILDTEPGELMKGGPTRAALMRRGLVHDWTGDAKVAGTLTEEGLRLRENRLETQRRAERAEALKAQQPITDAEAEANSAEEIAELEELGLIRDPLEPELPTLEAPGAAGDRYMSTGPGADVKARDARVIPELPQRVAGKALTEELTGEVFAPVSASADLKELGVTEGTPEAVSAVLEAHSGLAVASVVDAARPGARVQVQMRLVGGEILECVSRETMTAVGAEWGAWEGRRVRIGGMDDSIMMGRHLLIVLTEGREPRWVRDTDRSMPTPAALTDGCLVMVNGYPHRVRLRENGALGPMLIRVR